MSCRGVGDVTWTLARGRVLHNNCSWSHGRLHNSHSVHSSLVPQRRATGLWTGPGSDLPTLSPKLQLRMAEGRGRTKCLNWIRGTAFLFYQISEGHPWVCCSTFICQMINSWMDTMSSFRFNSILELNPYHLALTLSILLLFSYIILPFNFKTTYLIVGDINVIYLVTCPWKDYLDELNFTDFAPLPPCIRTNVK